MLTHSQSDICNSPWHVMELVSAFCLAASANDSERNPNAEQFYADAQRLKVNLDVVFSEKNRREFLDLIKYINDHREEYRKSLLLWLDLIEEFTFEMEQDLGDGAGAVKLRRVRGAVFYLLFEATKNRHVPGFPGYLNKLGLHIVVRGTVEFIVSLVNVPKVERVLSGTPVPGLWSNTDSVTGMVALTGIEHPRPFGRLHRFIDPIFVAFLKWWEPCIERIVNWMLDKLMAPPWVSPSFKQRVDAIVQRTGKPILDDPGAAFFQIVAWVGSHGDEMRAAIDSLMIAVHWTARMSDLSRDERIDLIVEALVLYFHDIGLRGPLFRAMVRVLVDIGLEAILYLYQKRGVPLGISTLKSASTA